MSTKLGSRGLPPLMIADAHSTEEKLTAFLQGMLGLADVEVQVMTDSDTHYDGHLFVWGYPDENVGVELYDGGAWVAVKMDNESIPAWLLRDNPTVRDRAVAEAVWRAYLLLS